VPTTGRDPRFATSSGHVAAGCGHNSAIASDFNARDGNGVLDRWTVDILDEPYIDVGAFLDETGASLGSEQE
jgi:hypothetical protein